MRLGDIFDPELPVTHRTDIPAVLQRTIATEAHQGALGGHIGTTKLCGALRRRFYWVGQYNTARDVVKGCMRCAFTRSGTHQAGWRGSDMGKWKEIDRLLIS